MKIEEIVYDIKHLLNALTDDTRVNDAHLIFKINNYREMFVNTEIIQTGQNNKEFYQKLPGLTVSSVGSGDLSGIDGTIKFGKVNLPSFFMDKKNNEPLLNLYLLARHKRLYYIDRAQLMEMIEGMDPRLDYTDYFIYEGGQAIYTYPFHEKITGDGMLKNPLEANKFYTTNEPLYNLEIGVEYIVSSGYVKAVPDGTLYKKGELFTATANVVYSGDGIVFRTTNVVKNTMQDEYPCSGEMAQMIVLQILAKDFMLERQSVVDIINDANDQFKVLKSQR